MEISLKIGQSIKKTKKYNMILEKTILDSKNYFLFITFANLVLIIGVNMI